MKFGRTRFSIIMTVLILFVLGTWGYRLAHRIGFVADAGKVDVEKWSAKNCRLIPGGIGLEDFAPTSRPDVWITGGFDRIAHRPGALYTLKFDSAGNPPRLQPVPYDPLSSQSAPEIFPHGIETFRDDDGLHLYVIDHGPERSVIEEYSVAEVITETGNADPLAPYLKHQFTWQAPGLIVPNSLVVLDRNHLLVSLDHGIADSAFGKSLAAILSGAGPRALDKIFSFIEDFSTIGQGKIVSLQRQDKTVTLKTLAGNFAFANGMALDRKSSRLFFAEMLARKLHIFRVDLPSEGDVRLVQESRVDLPGYPDNMAIDGDNLWIALHSDILKIAAHSKNPALPSPGMALARSLSTGDQTAFALDANALSGISIAQPVSGGMLFGSIYREGVLYCAH